MEKSTVSMIASIVLTAVIALLAVFGYNIAVVQPQLEALQASVEQLTMMVEGPAGGTTNLDSLTLSGNLQYGTQALYPVGAATSGKELAPGTVLTPVQKATVPASVHALSTVTWAQCEPRTKSFSGAWTCGAQIGSSNQLTLTLYNAAATPVPTAAYGAINWMAAGN